MSFEKSTRSFALHTSLAPLCALAALGVGCQGDPSVSPVEHTHETAMSFEEFEARTYRELDSGIYIVDGDTPITTLDELEDFYVEHVRQGALIVNRAGSGDDRWSDAQKLNLSYCVSKTFGNRYDAVVQAMAAATGAWEQAANIKYVHLSAEDDKCTAGNTSVLFDVNPVNSGQYLARAFFPSNGRPSRNVLIDSGAFSAKPPVTLTGVLRHELGHTLGFRHEHTRPEAATCFEDKNWRALTSYDSNSVMHYPQCNGTNKGDLNLTSLDRTGVVSLYGSPGGGGGSGSGGAGPGPGPGPGPGTGSGPTGSGGAGPGPGPGPGSGPTGSGGGGGNCAHPVCSPGPRLDPACDPCVAQVCSFDPHCCGNVWDNSCVSKVPMICGQTCGGGPGTGSGGTGSGGGGGGGYCAHPICSPGTKLKPFCDPCVTKICSIDTHCCAQQWDASCVGKVAAMCGVSCP